jgi:hypothetical protein
MAAGLAFAQKAPVIEAPASARRITADEMRRIDTDLAGDGVDLPEPSLECFNGWLSPGGRLYPCMTGKHVPLAQQLAAQYELGGEDGERLLTRAGWAKLLTPYSMGAASIWRFHGLVTGEIHQDYDRLTPNQSKAVREWHEIHGLQMDDLDRAPKGNMAIWVAQARARRVDGD